MYLQLCFSHVFWKKKTTPTHRDCTFLKAKNCILWSICFQKMFVKMWSDICCCHCNGTWLAVKLYKHLKIVVLFQRGCVWGGRLSLEKKKKVFIALHLLLPGVLCSCLQHQEENSPCSGPNSHFSVWDLPGHFWLLVPGDLCCISTTDESCLMLISRSNLEEKWNIFI